MHAQHTWAASDDLMQRNDLMTPSVQVHEHARMCLHFLVVVSTSRMLHNPELQHPVHVCVHSVCSVFFVLCISSALAPHQTLSLACGPAAVAPPACASTPDS